MDVLLLYVISLAVLLYLIASHRKFSIYAFYFILSWILLSVSVFLSAWFNLDLAEIGGNAEFTFAPVVLNLVICLNFIAAAYTYLACKRVTIAPLLPKSSEFQIDRLIFYFVAGSSFILSAKTLLPIPPLFNGIPISVHMASLNVLERFCFVSIAISSLPLSVLAQRGMEERRWGRLVAFTIGIVPSFIWALAGEKMGYLLFIITLMVLPWINKKSDSNLKYFIWGFLAITFSVLLVSLQYRLQNEDPLQIIKARSAMQGQLWHFAFLNANYTEEIIPSLRMIFGSSGNNTIRVMMEHAMPTELFAQYQTAVLTGSHFPSLLFVFGWSAVWMATIICGIVFGISIVLMRLALESKSLMICYLVVGSVIFPGIEVWVSGNVSRLFQVPPTFIVFMVLSFIILVSKVRYR
jgi:hypothetical protein